MGNESKVIRKTDDSAMALLHEVLGDGANDIIDVDSYYNINGSFVFLEFIKVKEKPLEYDPSKNLEAIYKRVSIIFDFTLKAEGVLWLVCYDNAKEHFKLFKLKDLTSASIDFLEIMELDNAAFKKWFQKLNSDVLNSK